MQDPCINPTLCYVLVQIFPSVSKILIFVYILVMEDQSIGGAEYCSIMSMIISWFIMSNVFADSENTTKVYKL